MINLEDFKSNIQKEIEESNKTLKEKVQLTLTSLLQEVQKIYPSFGAFRLELEEEADEPYIKAYISLVIDLDDIAKRERWKYVEDYDVDENNIATIKDIYMYDLWYDLRKDPPYIKLLDKIVDLIDSNEQLQEYFDGYRFN